MNTLHRMLHTPCQDCDHPAYQHWIPRRTGNVLQVFHCTYPLPGGSPWDPPCDCPEFVPPADLVAA